MANRLLSRSVLRSDLQTRCRALGQGDSERPAPAIVRWIAISGSVLLALVDDAERTYVGKREPSDVAVTNLDQDLVRVSMD